MNKNNVKILTDEELEFLESRYYFEINDNMILVKIHNYNRATAHSIDKSFALNTKVRKIDITPTAIDIWNNYFKDKYSLFKVQNAINILIMTYQTPDVSDVREQLERGTPKIKII